MKKEFVMRGQTTQAKGTEVLNFSGYKPGYAYRLVEFQLFPSVDLATDFELTACITSGKTALDPQAANFNDDGLIGSILLRGHQSTYRPISSLTVINDTFLITQNLLLTIFSTGSNPVNWQCRFVSEKMSGSEEAVANYRQFTISDG